MKSENGVLRYDTYHLTPSDRIRYGTTGVLLAGMVSRCMYKSTVLFLILAVPAFIFYPVIMRQKLKEKRLEKLSAEFKEAIGILSGFLSAGYSVANAFGAAAGELEKLFGRKADISVEFAGIYRKACLNVPVGEVLTEFGERSGLPDIKNFAEVFTIAGKTGGSLRDIIERTAGVIREKMAVSEEIVNMTASRRFEQKIMNVIPFFIILYLDLTNPGFLDVMYTTPIGRTVMTVCLGLIVLALFLSGKILSIRV